MTSNSYSIETHLDKLDLENIAALHCSSLPEDILPMLGREYLKHFYFFLNGSRHERIFVVRNQDSRILAVCVLSLSPNNLSTRALASTFPQFFRSFFCRFLESAAFRNLSFAILGTALRGGAPNLCPEIVFIFTDSNERGRGLGSLLLKEAENYLKGEKINVFYVKTYYTSNGMTTNFYRKNNFQICGRSPFGKKIHLIFKKQF